ncbi:hypothetical protein EYF80_033569 [Liparis tanakae]|uniref:Uncharacterized protein n=1 Tax=Liparis tanakae TaxID=230148 RepID=A0A4Z2GTX1_9TELE|nr:hypothetical protein EYF80_033569 [Liparis tanakae]
MEAAQLPCGVVRLRNIFQGHVTSGFKAGIFKETSGAPNPFVRPSIFPSSAAERGAGGGAIRAPDPSCRRRFPRLVSPVNAPLEEH